MNSKFIGLTLISVFFLMAFPSPSSGQEGLDRFDVSSSIDWVRGELTAQASYDIVQAGIRLPTGRFLAEETLREAYPVLIMPHLFSIRVDSSSTIRNLVEQGDISLDELDILCREAGKITPNLSADLRRMTGRFTLPAGRISSLLVRQRRPTEQAGPLIPVQTADYTGIIIIADRELPVRGRRAAVLAEPCLFPRIWDTDMNLVYERNMTEAGRQGNTMIVQYTASESIFRPTPSGLEGELAVLAGPNPLRIIAREVFGIFPSDPVIDRQDALKILSSENNRRLLREGRVILVLNEKTLKTAL